MICKKCGEEVRKGATFCPKCGEKVLYSTNITETNNSKGNNKLIMILGVIVAVIVLAIVIVPNINNTRIKTNVVDTVNNNVKENSVDQEKIQHVKDDINGFISQYSSHSDVSVAIIDNHTAQKISSLDSEDQYTAWGFYLPVYYAYGTRFSFDQTAINILSSDISLCNTNANTAIDKLGGLHNLNEQLKQEFSTKKTEFGRLFAETNASGDNYTNAIEAVEFLYRLDVDGNAARLSNRIHDFGIYEPSNATVCAQVGTENRAVLKNLNLFAIVKDGNLDYSVVILTRNSKGGIITDLLAFIHKEMRSSME